MNDFKLGDMAEVVMSETLQTCRLEELVGSVGEVVETNATGCWILMEKPFLDEVEWFIPNNSLILIKN